MGRIKEKKPLLQLKSNLFMQRLTLDLEEEDVRLFKMHAVEMGQDMSKLLRILVKDHIKEHNLKRRFPKNA
jgi:hypothetical protein